MLQNNICGFMSVLSEKLCTLFVAATFLETARI